MATTKPSMFIGSSVEGKRIAETIQLALEYEVHSTIWHQGVFGLSEGTLESLVAASNDYDFATLVLTADDLLERRHASGKCPRDNVLFELGLFMGALGRSRTFIVHSRTTPPMLPSDLAGITPATYEDRPNLVAALGPACTKLRHAVERSGIRPKLADASDKDSEIAILKKMQSEQHAMITQLFQKLIAGPDRTADGSALQGVSFLEGAWISYPDQSHAYCVFKQGRPRIVYCYSGDHSLTGEYFDVQRMGHELVGRFRWFDHGLDGFAWLKIEDESSLSGAWWMAENVPEHARHDPVLLKKSKSMNSYVWKKRARAPFPAWAAEALERIP